MIGISSLAFGIVAGAFATSAIMLVFWIIWHYSPKAKIPSGIVQAAMMERDARACAAGFGSPPNPGSRCENASQSARVSASSRAPSTSRG